MSLNKLSRQWDEYDAYLFDIDGTLINCTDAVHFFAFCEALSCVSGRPLNLDGVVTHGNTDIGILRDAFARAQVPEETWRARIPELRDSMTRFVSSRRKELCANMLPQVRELLLHLKSKGAKLGVATGNLEAIGKMKLESAGLLDLFDFGAWSDPFEHRADVFHAAVKKARALVGSHAAILVIGDTPADINAAKKNGLAVIAVATGIYSTEQLRVEAPELCICSFEELLAPGL
jgi:phosphoglycolate phosphatase